jgi:hypothetical protein
MIVATAGLALALATSPGPARLQATADEFSLVLSRTRLKAGPALVELVNFGEDDHDLRLRRVGPKTTRTWRIPVVHPGDRDELQAILGSGTFRVWCAVADHRKLGMRATLVVVP